MIVSLRTLVAGLLTKPNKGGLLPMCTTELIILRLLIPFLDFVAINLYQYYCAERSIWGYFVSSITTQFPHCKALRWVTDISVTTLDHYWMLIIAATVSRCTGILGGQLVKTNK